MGEPVIPARDRWALLGIALVALVWRTAFLFDAVFRGGYVNFQDTDAWYHMRVIDNIVRNFPHRMLVDPFAAPTPQPVAIAPLFDLVVAAAAWLIGLGSPSPRTVDVVGAFAPAVMGALATLPIYLLGTRLFGRTAGLLAAGLLAVTPGHFLARSVLGFTDHHVAEAALSATALLFVVAAVQQPDRRRRLRMAAAAGGGLAAYLLTWTGAALVVFIVCAWAVAQYNLDALHGRSDDRVAWVALPAIALATVLVLLLHSRAMWRFGTQLAALFGGLALIAGLEALRRIIAALRLPRAAFPLGVLALAAAGLTVFVWRAPGVAHEVLIDLRRFNPGDTGFTVAEIRPLLAMTGTLSWKTPLQIFGTPFVIGLGALLWLAWRAAVDDEPALTLVVVWSVVMYLATLGQNRFGYYLAVNLSLLTACAATAALRWAWAPPVAKTASRQARRRGTIAAPSRAWGVGAIVLVAAAAFAPNVMPAWGMVRSDLGLSRGWHVSLDWLRRNTPEPFPDSEFYFARYRSAELPPPAYVVMAWWDYGYEIIRLGHRVPIANPTQAGAEVAGRFLTATDQREADRIMDETRSRYAIVDWELPILPRGRRDVFQGKYQTAVTWAGKKPEQFYEIFHVRTQTGQLGQMILFHPDYYRSMLVRLYVFRGEAATPGPDAAWVVKVADRTRDDGTRFREVLEARKFKTYEGAAAFLAGHPDGGYRLVGPDPRVPCVPIEAVSGYRLIHESPDAAERPSGTPSVRIFEYLSRR
jgi:dolichyl-diphosphooligosaccharide--protein glycosyltransferase